MDRDAPIPKNHFAPILPSYINPSCSFHPIAGVMRMRGVCELSWDYVATTQINEYHARDVLQDCWSFKYKSETNEKQRNFRHFQTLQILNGTGEDDSHFEKNIDKKSESFRCGIILVASGNFLMLSSVNFVKEKVVLRQMLPRCFKSKQGTVSKNFVSNA